MYINPNKGERTRQSFPKIREDGRNVCDFFKADLIGNRKFLLNHGGYPRNDISIIEEQTDVKAAKALVDSLAVLPDVKGFDNVNDALLSLRSKYQQTPSEIIPYIEKRLDDRLVDERARLAAEKAAKGTIDFTNDSNSESNE